MVNTTPNAFNAFAHSYDNDFTHSHLGRLLRQRVWDVYSRYYRPGHHLLELTCGTGADALWLAQQSIHITATDASPHMLTITQQKAEQANLTSHLTTLQLSLQDLIHHSQSIKNPPQSLNSQFDGLYTNFGGLNTINQWHDLAQAIAPLIKPNGILILVPMGPRCPWEVAWYGLHGRFSLALRRWHQPTTATVGQHTIPIWYPSARQLRHAFAPWFQHLTTESLGILLPPSYLKHLVEKRPFLFNRLNRWEKHLTPFTGGWGDHYILVLTKQ